MKWKSLSRILIVAAAVLAAAGPAPATEKTFPAGSFVIPTDACWQPNTDGAQVAGLYYPSNPDCDPDVNDRGIFHAYGMLYAMLDRGDDPVNCSNTDGTTPFQKKILGDCQDIPIYWIIDKTKTDPQTPDLSISGATPVATILASTKADTGTLSPVEYRGGPFVVDANDLTQAQMAKFMTAYPDAKVHIVNVDFTANVDKILIGRPPKIAVLGEGATQVLQNYLMASGLFTWNNYVFKTVTSPDIVSDVLDDFQLVWAPHWIVEDEADLDGDGTVTVAEQDAVIGKIRTFIENGNAGFFECASIESLEGSWDTNKGKGAGLSVGVGGFLLSNSYSTNRIEINNGLGDQKKGSFDAENDVVYEDAAFYLTQCGGWKYDATGGHVHNMRPSMAKSYVYNDTVTRFIHDDPAAVSAGSYYSMGTDDYYVYDYFVGGRINGAPGQGYVTYFPGHKYIECASDTGTLQPERILAIQFDAPLAAGTTVKVEAVHANCTPGTDCPVATLDLTALTDPVGSSEVDDYIYLDMDAATYTDNGDGTSTVGNILIGNITASNLTVTDYVVTYDLNPATRVTSIDDVTNSSAVCTPNSTSPASCAGTLTEEFFEFTFSNASALAGANTVTIEVEHAGCSHALGTCPTATWSASGGGTSGSDGTIEVDLSAAAAAGPVLQDVIFRNLTSSAVVITEIYTTFSGGGNLQTIYSTTNSTTVCSPNMASQSKCFDVTQLCPSAVYDIASGPGAAYEDANLKIDMSSADFNSDRKKLKRVKLVPKNNAVCGDIHITRIGLVWPASDMEEFKKIKDRRDNSDLWKPPTKVKSSPMDSCFGDASLDKDLNDGGSTVEVDLEFKKNRGNSGQVAIEIGYTCESSGESCGACNTASSYCLGDCTATGFELGPFSSSCNIDWGKSNTCGIKYVLNTLLALKFQVVNHEYSKVMPIVEDNVLYRASFKYPSYRGHLTAWDMVSNPAVQLWDAADRVPDAGDTGTTWISPSGLGGSGLSATQSLRYIFTNEPGTTNIIDFTPDNQATLAGYLGTTADGGGVYPTSALINTIRGRANATETAPYGDGEQTDKLWAIENSTPALMSCSDLAEDAPQRDKFLFVGADDGMLHAFYAGSMDTTTDPAPDPYDPANPGDSYTACGDFSYDLDNANAGKEIWAYIPSTLLSTLKNQPFEPDFSDPTSNFEPVVSVDGSPAIGDFYIDTDGDGTPDTFKTVLVGTAEIRNINQGIVFALDVNDPYNPKLLWEHTYNDTTAPGCSGTDRNCNMGNTKGVAIGRVQVGTDIHTYVFVASSWHDKQTVTDSGGNPVDVYGLNITALEFETGDVVWHTALPYTPGVSNSAQEVNDTPAIPALMDLDNNFTSDVVLVGDMQGRLWGLWTHNGESLQTE